MRSCPVRWFAKRSETGIEQNQQRPAHEIFRFAPPITFPLNPYGPIKPGTPLLLVHGTTADHRRWSAISPQLEQHFTVYAMDRRGRGGSANSPDYDIMREAEDVAAVPVFQSATELVDSTLSNAQIVVMPDQRHIAMDGNSLDGEFPYKFVIWF